jgi:hypothetical protein
LAGQLTPRAYSSRLLGKGLFFIQISKRMQQLLLLFKEMIGHGFLEDLKQRQDYRQPFVA